MESRMQQGYLVLADISGFTSYLAGVELDHAHEILSDLLEVIVDHFQPLLTLSKLEGDAVFAYAPESRLSRGETLLEILESTYVAFRNRVETVRRHTTCQCNACRSIPKLDLKFIAHYGAYILQVVAGASELLGSDVNLVHRLLKNHVGDVTGWHAYALFTSACLEKLCVWPEKVHQQTETYEHLGDVQTFSLDLHTRYKELQDARRVFLAPEEADATLSREFSAPVPMVWGWMTDPQRRTQWMTGSHWYPGSRPGGRTGAGARNHCAHGKSESLEEVLDWRPFDYYTSRHTPDPKRGMRIIMTFQFTPAAGGTYTHAQLRIKVTGVPVPRRLHRLVGSAVLKMSGMPKSWENMARLIAEETASEPAPEPVPARLGQAA